ncbi:MAG: DegT/DnrJ/EryC1/StrS family aminotransferase [Reyranella sp.]|jgi:8-amino-3,8-dideoxy-alpha-D-manno-octulosonate transaminase|uniref:DegT/DnrJ/EryC1/StrS family aminotransferase n=1 Tax=Reyranella sp. TaxID=1929291 RepID=UPI00095E8EB0|nr:DegT/DnrJ/EryC1/StrS family aminotransferase [Reyranella sp.]MBN9539461.1 DegT/DnrJ/EryC1/StrS family aminotransferase [Alphaproteobacteria bacterium]MBR2814342.1 DegT/DnrJ/EryC1/StrS family aminotransferase [Reyranella sp.]OJU46815.1 MAG: DegT/DnrJ/EryC1/StrS aminotransferase [Alphaproteobacteria bacterium 65-37]
MTADTRHLSNRLAIDGGTPVRSTPLPWELPGAYYIDEEEKRLVNQVIDARSPFRFYGLNAQGMVDRLESEWCSTFGHKHALGVNSGSAALHIALAAFGVGPGDEVLVPGYMWVSCMSAIVRTGAIPRLVDIDGSFCMDPADLERKIGPRSKAVLFVNMSGAMGRNDRIAEICRKHNLRLLEDCAQAIGGSLKGRSAGSFGDIGIYSFQLNKNMTSGEGGLLVTEDEDLYKRCVALHDLGYARTAEGRLDPSDERYQYWGIGSRMSELSGAMALAQMRKVRAITAKMREAKWKIREAIKDIPGIALREIDDPAGDTGPVLITVYPTAEACQRFVEAIRAEGVRGPEGSLTCITMREWGMHWYFNIPSLVKKRSNAKEGFPWTHPANAFATDYSYAKGQLPVCDAMSERAALLTVASVLKDADIDDIIAAFRKVGNAFATYMKAAD